MIGVRFDRLILVGLSLAQHRSDILLFIQVRRSRGPTPNVEAQIFAASATLLRDVGKIPLVHPLTQILDPHLLYFMLLETRPL